MEQLLDNTEVFTGERFIPELFTEKDEIYQSHTQRYQFAKKYIGKSDFVLDISCGEGYGTSILQSSAKKVVGVDIDSQVVIRAQEKYAHDGVEFVCGNAESELFPEQYFD